MRKLIQIITAATVGSALITGVAAADPATCNIYNTGSDSYNSCTQDSSQEARVTCQSNIYVLDQNSQDAGTGGAVVSGNGQGGNAVSGTALNENNTSVSIGASCGTVAVAPVTPSTPAAKPAGSKGASAPAAAPAAQAKPAAKPASLPETGSNTAQTIATDSVIAVGGTLAISQVAIRAYRRLALR